MQQLTQKLKDGNMQILEVPVPSLGPGTVLVKNHYSLVSAGTEGSTVKTARKSMIGKAKERPQQAKQVLDVLRSQGIVQTYRAVMKKLDAHSPLGYSCVGEVIGVGSDVHNYAIGDFVACGGLTANHAEVVAVPENLCARVDEGADLKQAAYNTLGAIAMQGVRQADLRFGESCAVIGLGLLGQLTCQLLQASGVRVIGIDISEAMVKMAAEHGADMAMTRNEPGVKERIMGFTEGLGVDSVIITAATDSLDPVNFAGSIARKRGSVIIVGAVPTGFDREPHYYKKELSLRMSCSYGPGRYDPEYEDKGRDYPAAYVRWTEGRNMRAFQEAVSAGRINVSHLTTHVFSLDDAPNAYDMIVNRSEPSVGILIEYDAAKEQKAGPVELKPAAVKKTAKVSIGFIGAGSYAQSHLLPNIPKDGDCVLKGVMTATSAGARSSGDRYGFEFCSGNAADILENDEINTVFIATRHDTHAPYVKEAIKHGKNVFVEKPLCMTLEELDEIVALYEEKKASAEGAPQLMVGYNRRFAPFVMDIKKKFGSLPVAGTYRVNCGDIPADSWIQDHEIGGGRIIGEVCHFIDTLTYLSGSLVTEVSAYAMPDPQHLNDIVQIGMRYENGSIGQVAYLSNGDKSMPKEYLEVFAGGMSAVVEDYKSTAIYAKGKKEAKKLMNQDKGQKNEVTLFLEACASGGAPVISFEEIVNTSLATFKVHESLIRGESVKVYETPEA